MKSSSKKSDPTTRDALQQMMSQLHMTSPTSTDHTEGQHQTSQSHSSGLSESHPQTTPATTKKQMRLKKLPNEPSEEDGFHEGPKQVMVLEATKPFTYDIAGNKKMFHATVATDTEFFRVKVFEENLQDMFTPQRVIAFSDYFGSYGSLVIHKASSVSEVTNSMEISRSLTEKPIPNPKIRELHSITREIPVNGKFKIHEKCKGTNCIYYVIKDRTGKMKVVVSGHLTNVSCKTGDTVRLVCFELTSDVNEWFLRAGRYSYMEVIKPKEK